MLENEIESIRKELPIRIDTYTEHTNVEMGTMEIKHDLAAFNRLAKQAESAVKKQRIYK